MKIKINKIDIYTKNDLISFSFDSNITFIYGNIGVGKSTLLSLIFYCMGGDLVETPAVNAQFLSVGLQLELNTQKYIFRREYKSSRIFVKDMDSSVYNIDRKKISEFLYKKSGLSMIYYERQGTDTPNLLTFKNYLWYSYLKQEDIDSNFFYLGKGANEFYQIASTNTLSSFLGKDSFINQEEKRILSEKKKKLRKYENGMVALNYVINEDLIHFITEEYKRLSLQDIPEAHSFKALKRTLTNYERFVGEYSELKKQVECLTATEPDNIDSTFHNNLVYLGEIFKECLISIGFPSISKADNVIYDKKSLNPTVINEYTNSKYSFDLLGSGGKKTLFKICFLLALHIITKRLQIAENRLPSLIVIDTPMKNISEREDKELFDNFYSYLLKLSMTELADTQMIIIDKEKNDIIAHEKAKVILISKDNPLFPEYVDSN